MRMGGEWRGQSMDSNTPTQEPPGAGALHKPRYFSVSPPFSFPSQSWHLQVLSSVQEWGQVGRAWAERVSYSRGL